MQGQRVGAFVQVVGAQRRVTETYLYHLELRRAGTAVKLPSAEVLAEQAAEVRFGRYPCWRNQSMQIRVTYDGDADAAYIYLTEIKPGEDARQVEVIPGAVLLSFDSDERLIGIEILSASRRLPSEVCREAEQIGRQL